jgi:hypothetical protein
MKTSITQQTLCSAVLGLGLATGALAQAPKSSKPAPLAVEDEILLSVTATV